MVHLDLVHRGALVMLVAGGSVQLLLTLIHVSVGKSSFGGTDVISLQGVSSIGHSTACEIGSWSMTTAQSVCSALLSSVLSATDRVSEPLVLVLVSSCNSRPPIG